jgi:hypothetical protein
MGRALRRAAKRRWRQRRAYAGAAMTKPFVPLGYIRVADFDGDRSTLRHRLASGELEGVVLDSDFGKLVPVHNTIWLSDKCQNMIDTGTFFDSDRRQYFPIFIKLAAPPANTTTPTSGKRKTGPKASTLERVKREMQLFGIEAVLKMKVIDMEDRFKAGRGTVLKARDELSKSLSKKL